MINTFLIKQLFYYLRLKKSEIRQEIKYFIYRNWAERPDLPGANESEMTNISKMKQDLLGFKAGVPASFEVLLCLYLYMHVYVYVCICVCIQSSLP